MSFYTSLTGLNASTAQLGVTSNNIANVGTTGFKRSRADFGDIFATSPLQKASSVIGQGVSLKQVTQEFSQGNIQFSANSLDIAITGDGFFPLKSADGLQDIYTRNGSFFLDDSFAVVNSAGQSLVSAAVDSSGKADLGNLSKLIIPRTTTGDAVATEEITLALNLPADADVISLPFDKNDPKTYNKTTAVTVYDSGGNDYLATVYYVKTQRASPEEPYNKWQSYVYVGDDKLDELLIPATNDDGEALYVNSYGQLKTLAEITESGGENQTLNNGAPLYLLDDIKQTRTSTPAYVQSNATYIDAAIDWEAGVDVYQWINDKVAETTANSDQGQQQTITFDLTANGGVTTSGTMTVSGVPITIAAGLNESALAAAVALELNRNAFILSREGRTADANAGAVEIGLRVKDGDWADIVIDAGTTGATATVATVAAVTTFSDAVAAELADFNMEMSVDGATATIDLSGLYDETAGERTGTEIARYIANEINKDYGDDAYFNFEPYVNGSNVLMTLKVTTSTDTIGQEISLKAATGVGDLVDGFVSDASRLSIPDAIALLQAQIDEAVDKDGKDYFGNMTVGYNAVSQSFTFKVAESNYVVSAGAPIENELLGLSATSRSSVSNETGTWGARVIPNGEAIRSGDYRYGMDVEWDATNEFFSFSSGSTGDDSTIKTVGPTWDADNPAILSSLLGVAGTVEMKQSQTPTRGVGSSAAVLEGNPIGVNLDFDFQVDATNNTFIVTIDEVTGVVQLPIRNNYTRNEFITELAKRINSLGNASGQTVGGVRVEYTTTEPVRLRFTSGTNGNDSYIKISGSNIWGLADLNPAKGTTAMWSTPSSAKNESLSPLYVDRDGNETTTSPGTAVSKTDWALVYLDKGEVTFDASGAVVSPASFTHYKPATIGDSGATLEFSINLSESTQYSAPFAILKQEQNGRPEGDLLGVDIGDDGLVSASYSNGTQKSLAKIVMANFPSPQGLRQIGDSSFYTTAKSGTAEIGEPGSAGYGTLRAGATERANVDLTQELVDLITAQRNFQANAKAIETSTTMTQAIIQIRA
jgi:flagellar hook-basal body protein